MAISVRLTDYEEQIIREYAVLNDETVSSAIRRIVMEKIEDEIDVKILEKAIENSSGKTLTAEEVGKELDLL